MKHILTEVHHAVIGQESMLKNLLIGILADGHVLLEGLPGLAKTTAVNAFAQAIDLKFHRIQFTPDLLPADILGTMIYNAHTAEFETRKGPIFANLILADEINRAPSKVQSALLEAMQEKQVTIGETTYALEAPFLVLATQNPIEQDGTYTLPEAQVDRFMLKVLLDYPTLEEEIEIMRAVSGGGFEAVNSVSSASEILKARETIKKVHLDEKLEEYIVRLVHATRRPKEYDLENLENLIDVGASPRASIDLAKASKAHAFLEGRDFVSPEDIHSVALPVLRHRIALSYEAEAEELTSDAILKIILNFGKNTIALANAWGDGLQNIKIS